MTWVHWELHRRSSHEFIATRRLVHSWFVGLSTSLKVIVHYFLIEEMVGLDHCDEFPMMSALVCMVIHWIRLTMSHDLRLLSCHDFIKLFHNVVFQSWKNTELVLRLVATLTYKWYHKLIICILWIGLLLMKASNNRYS